MAIKDQEEFILTQFNDVFHELFSSQTDLKKGTSLKSIFKNNSKFWQDKFKKILDNGKPEHFRIHIKNQQENYIAKCFLTDENGIEVFIHSDFSCDSGLQT